MPSLPHPMPPPKKKSRVMILATGGTIAGTAPANHPNGYVPGKLPMDAMINAIPGIHDLTDIQWRQVAGIGSQDMTFSLMAHLANQIGALFESDTADGVVVPHGTDTVEETAYFLNLVVKSSKPVVLTGAMRPFFTLSSDGPRNLFSAVAVAADAKAVDRGVLVVMNDQIHGARSVQKCHTLDVAAFTSRTCGLMGAICGDCLAGNAIRYFRRPFRKHTHQSEFSVSPDLLFPRVDILYACADMPGDLIDGAVERGARGIVIAGVGNGNMNDHTIRRAAAAVQKGVAVVRSSHVGAGCVLRNVEIDDDAMGFVVANDLPPSKARILLMLALMKNHRPDQIQALFDTY
ncbi:asparaginase [Desulfosarcina sp. OttesenSCG-928-A07]|nr:asparaginase [Desulfosarcina sp. OttesenSCG-928-G17]MDL2328808.1 asparaginase [Desulfosarcina sp. OttesenSCG-928-A07]